MSESLICQKIFSVRTNWRVKVVLELETLANGHLSDTQCLLAAQEQYIVFEVDNMEHHWPPYWRCPRDMDYIGWWAWLDSMGPFGRDRRVVVFRALSHFVSPYHVSPGSDIRCKLPDSPEVNSPFETSRTPKV
jgi:hypothetical protein